MDVGKIIKQARLKKGMTQEELATKVGVQKSAVAKWENGRVSEIKRTNLMKLATALDLPPVTLCPEEQIKEPTVQDGGLSENQRKLMEFVKSVPDDKAAMILKVIRSIVEAD